NTRFPIPCFAVFQKHCESSIRCSMLHRTTWTRLCNRCLLPKRVQVVRCNIEQKAAIAQAQGDLPRAAALLAPLHPNADDTGVMEIQVYQAILERRPAQVIARLKELLTQPDPALGFNIGELRFWLGWVSNSFSRAMT